MSKGNFGHPSQYTGKPVAKYVDIFAELAEGLPKGMIVTDLFGGLGVLMERLWPILEPSKVTSFEIDQELISLNVLRGNDRVNLIHGDAFYVRCFGDLVLIDPHRGTLNAIAKLPEWQLLFEAIKSSGAVRYVLMQEYGAYWCHLPNQKKLYRDMFGYYVDKTNYRLAFSDYVRKRYGFQVTKHKMGLGSCYYLMEVK